MRVTADSDDPDFRPEFMGCKVFLDGVEQRDCMEADDIAGTVTVLLRGHEGFLITTSKDGDLVLKTEIRRGNVRIELLPGLFRPSWPA